jgi:putative acetyltransferase
VHIRPYEDKDAVATYDIFERAIHTTAAGHYSEEQLDAWAPRDLDASGLASWGARRAAAQTLVAVEDDEAVGFSDLVDGTLLDMLFVDPRFGRRGVASALISSIVELARAGGAPHLETHASLVARPVFERHGFVVVTQQTPVIRGVAMTNFKMYLSFGRA